MKENTKKVEPVIEFKKYSTKVEKEVKAKMSFVNDLTDIAKEELKKLCIVNALLPFHDTARTLEQEDVIKTLDIDLSQIK